jgi:hypothetical protein
MRAQKKLMKRLHADLEVTIAQENFAPEKERKGQKMLQRNGEGQNDTGRTATAEYFERDDFVQIGWKVQGSAAQVR